MASVETMALNKETNFGLISVRQMDREYRLRITINEMDKHYHLATNISQDGHYQLVI